MGFFFDGRFWPAQSQALAALLCDMVRDEGGVVAVIAVKSDNSRIGSLVCQK